MSYSKNEVLSGKEKKKFILLIILFCASLVLNEAFAQTIPISKLSQNKYALQNLKQALSSENYGIKRSAIYLIGKYKIAEGEIILEKMLHQEKDPCSRILITLVLLELNEPRGLVALKELAKTELNAESRRLATFTFNEYLINDLGTDEVGPK